MPPVVTDPVFDTCCNGDGVVVRVTGCTGLTEKNVSVFGKLLTGLVEQHPGKPLSLDLSEIAYLTSVALAKIISANARVRREGGHFALLNLQSDVREVFAITKLDHIIDILPAT